MKTRFLTLAMLLLVPAWAGAATLSVTPGAALEGAFGMQLTYPGAGGQTFVQDNTPESEPSYNFEFRHNFNSVNMADGATQGLMFVRSDTPRNDIRVFLWCRNAACPAGGGAQMNLMFQARRDAGEPGTPWVHCARISAGPNANALFRVEMVKGSGSNDGTCRVFRNGVMLVERFDMPDDMDLDAHRWGALNPIHPSMAGSTYNDAFVSSR